MRLLPLIFIMLAAGGWTSSGGGLTPRYWIKRHRTTETLGMKMGDAENCIARKIAESIYGQLPAEVTTLAGGSVNHVYRASAGGRSIVIRLAKLEDEHRAADVFAKEEWCIQHAASVGIPGPRGIEIKRCDGRTYMLQEFATGRSGTDCNLNPETVWWTLGDYANHIHSIHLDGFGDNLRDFTSGAQVGWRRFVEYNLGCLIDSDPLLKLNVYSRWHQAQIKAAFSGLLEAPLQFGLTHCDISPRNVIVEPSGTVTLLDWGCAEAHIVPHYEIVNILASREADAACMLAFLAGYGINENVSNLLAEVRVLRLLKAFDLTRWAIDRCPARIESIASSARTLAANFVGVQQQMEPRAKLDLKP